MAALPTILVALDEAYESAENVPRLFMLLWVGGRCRGR